MNNPRALSSSHLPLSNSSLRSEPVALRVIGITFLASLVLYVGNWIVGDYGYSMSSLISGESSTWWTYLLAGAIPVLAVLLFTVVKFYSKKNMSNKTASKGVTLFITLISLCVATALVVPFSTSVSMINNISIPLYLLLAVKANLTLLFALVLALAAGQLSYFFRAPKSFIPFTGFFTVCWSLLVVIAVLSAMILSNYFLMGAAVLYQLMPELALTLLIPVTVGVIAAFVYKVAIERQDKQSKINVYLYGD